MNLRWTMSGWLACAMTACISTGDFHGHGDPGPGPGPEVINPLQAGHFVRVRADNAAFFSDLPLGEMPADMLLQKHTSMRLIQLSANYSRVELDSGQVGYVQTAILEAIAKPNPGLPEDPGNDPVPENPQLPVIPPIIDPDAVPLPPGG